MQTGCPLPALICIVQSSIHPDIHKCREFRVVPLQFGGGFGGGMVMISFFFFSHLPWVVANDFGQPCWKALPEWPASKAAIDSVSCTAAVRLKSCHRKCHNESENCHKECHKHYSLLFFKHWVLRKCSFASSCWGIICGRSVGNSWSSCRNILLFQFFSFVWVFCFWEGEQVSGSSTWKESRISRLFFSGASNESVMHSLLLSHFLEHR